MSLSWMPEKLRPIVYRLCRADECAYEMLEIMMNWSLNEPVEMGQEPNSREAVKIVVKRIRPIPPLLALLFSEAINHLRSSLDNVVWFFVEEEYGEIDQRKAPLISFPIKDTSKKFEDWQKARVKDGFNIFGEDNDLGHRIRSLQPFVDGSQQVESFSSLLAGITGEKRDNRHALKLLQAYSNEDKHRQIRLGVARSSINSSHEPYFAQERGFVELFPGYEIGEYPRGKPIFVEANNAIMINRPGGESIWANPAREISRLRGYVADVALPILIKGLELPGSIPVKVSLGDDNYSFEKRVAEAIDIGAIDRFEPRRQKLWCEANSSPPKRL